jgi:uncharacterized protein with HEPN domain
MAGSGRRLDDLLRDILAAIDDIRAFTAGLSEADFLELAEADRKTFRAVKDAIGQIGEAAKSIPADVRARHPRIDWRGMAGMRDQLVHRYFDVNLAPVWKTITAELDDLRQAVLRELGEAGSAAS